MAIEIIRVLAVSLHRGLGRMQDTAHLFTKRIHYNAVSVAKHKSETRDGETPKNKQPHAIAGVVSGNLN